MVNYSARSEPHRFSAVRSAVHESSKSSALVVWFLIGLCIPIQIMLGSTRLSVYRIVLLVAIVPAFTKWMTHKDIKICTADIFMILFGIFGAISLSVADGLEQSIQSSAIFFIETCGSYFLARSFVRTPENFETVAKILYYSVLIMLPFAIIENLTDRTLILDALGKFFPVWKNIWDYKRLGLERAQVVFEHPILFGVYCSCAFCLCIHILNYKKSFFRTASTSSLAFLGGFSSLSSGALTMMAAQLALTAWDRILKPVPMRWGLFALAVISAYITVDMLSNRTPIHVFVQYLTFSSLNSFTRILIFESGIEALWLRPWFGYGLTHELVTKWDWLTTSIDNFFLLMAVRHGIPVFFIMTTAIIFVFVRLGKAKITDDRVDAYRAGILICLGGLIVAGITVHYWNAVYCLFMFLLGAGMWTAEYKPPIGNDTEIEPKTNSGHLKRRRGRAQLTRDKRPGLSRRQLWDEESSDSEQPRTSGMRERVR